MLYRKVLFVSLFVFYGKNIQYNLISTIYHVYHKYTTIPIKMGISEAERKF